MVAIEEERMGWQEMRRGQLELAEDHFRRALELEPMRPDSLNGLGVVYLAWGELDEAEELFRMALIYAEKDLPRRRPQAAKLDPLVEPYLRALYHLAVTYIRQGLWDEAEIPLQQILAWDEDGMDGEAFALLGEACHRDGRLDEAVYYYERGLGHDVWCWYSLGSVYLSSGRSAEAERVLRHALHQEPEVGHWIMYFPKVVPLPNGTATDESFRQAVSYLVDHIDLWPEPSRRQLTQIADGLAPAL